MIDFQVNKEQHFIEVKPEGKLEADDFERLAKAIDSLAEEGQVKGLLIETKSFPGWKDFKAFTEHCKFIKGNHNKVLKIALVTDAALANIAEKIVPFILALEVKHFEYDKLDDAKKMDCARPGSWARTRARARTRRRPRSRLVLL